MCDQNHKVAHRGAGLLLEWMFECVRGACVRVLVFRSSNEPLLSSCYVSEELLHTKRWFSALMEQVCCLDICCSHVEPSCVTFRCSFTSLKVRHDGSCPTCFWPRSSLICFCYLTLSLLHVFFSFSPFSVSLADIKEQDISISDSWCCKVARGPWEAERRRQGGTRIRMKTGVDKCRRIKMRDAEEQKSNTE